MYTYSVLDEPHPIELITTTIVRKPKANPIPTIANEPIDFDLICEVLVSMFPGFLLPHLGQKSWAGLH